MRFVLLLTFLLLAACHITPFRLPNDTSQIVRTKMFLSRYPTELFLRDTLPDKDDFTHFCWKESPALLIATARQKDPIVFDPKEYCDPDKCSCTIPVSKLIAQMTPAFVLKHQQDVCGGGGPPLPPDVRNRLCTAYVARSAGMKVEPIPSEADLAMLRQ